MNTRTIITRLKAHTAAMLWLTSQAVAAGELCGNAENLDNYNNDYLKNFVTLQKGTDSWLFRDMDLKQEFGPNKTSLNTLVKLNRLLKQQGTKLVLVPTPTRALVHPEKLGEIAFNTKKAQRSYKDFIKQLNALGIATPKLYRLLEKTHNEPLFFARDHHWNSQGAQAVAKLTADIITASGKYQAIEKLEFSTAITGNDSNRGSLNKAAQILCNQQFAPETFDTYFTQRKNEIDLFADTATPKVVLVGTSNSRGALNFNFSGFLSQYTGVDILNNAESGSGQDKALYNYLTSSEFTINKPRFLIWELPSYYSMNNHSTLNRILEHLESQQKTARRAAK